jgi:hypothetical protein
VPILSGLSSWDELGAADGGLGQIWLGPDEFADAAADQRARFGIDEHLGHIGLG